MSEQKLLEKPTEELELETFDVEASRMAYPDQLHLQENRLENLQKELETANEEDKAEILEDIAHAEDAIAKLKDRILGNVAVNVK